MMLTEDDDMVEHRRSPRSGDRDRMPVATEAIAVPADHRLRADTSQGSLRGTDCESHDRASESHRGQKRDKATQNARSRGERRGLGCRWA